MTDADIPTPQEELDRKVIELLTSECSLVKQGRRDKHDFAYLGASLWTATAGLVSAEVSGLVGEVAKSAPDRPMKRHFFATAGAVVSVVWLTRTPGFAVIKRQPGKPPAITKNSADVGEREALIARVVASLAAAGFVEL